MTLATVPLLSSRSSTSRTPKNCKSLSRILLRLYHENTFPLYWTVPYKSVLLSWIQFSDIIKGVISKHDGVK